MTRTWIFSLRSDHNEIVLRSPVVYLDRMEAVREGYIALKHNSCAARVRIEPHTALQRGGVR